LKLDEVLLCHELFVLKQLRNDAFVDLPELFIRSLDGSGINGDLGLGLLTSSGVLAELAEHLRALLLGHLVIAFGESSLQLDRWDL